MNFKQLAASIAALSVLAAAPLEVRANSFTPPGPISIIDVEVAPASTDGEVDAGFVTVAFKNTSQIVATEVDFEVEDNGIQVGHIVDAGTFAPGVTIAHTFPNDSAVSGLNVVVSTVKFVHGSQWVPGA